SKGAAWPGFPNGTRPSMLPPDENRLDRKRQMLRKFASEDGELLVRLFGRPDLHQRIYDLSAAIAASPRGYLRIGRRSLGISLIGFWIASYAAVFLLAAAI